MKKPTRWISVVLIVALILSFGAVFAGCYTQAEIVAHNISKEADAFNVQRKLTVMNARTDTIMLELIGNFSLQNNGSSELEVICEIAEGVYQKHFVYLNEYTLYVVEDISNTNVSKYHYELNILPYTQFPVVADFTD